MPGTVTIKGSRLLYLKGTDAGWRPRIDWIGKPLTLTLIALALATGTVAFGQDGPPGITVPRVFPPNGYPLHTRFAGGLAR